MSGGEFYLYSIVEGHGEVTSLPRLLHKIWGDASHRLRTDEEPYRVPKAEFLNNKEKRRQVLSWAREVAQDSSKSGVLILMDADDDCCRKFLQGKKMQAVCADIKKILGNIPCVVVLIEKRYEFWFAAGLGGGAGGGGVDAFLSECLGKSYRKTRDQDELIYKMDIEQAAENNPSFCRFRERLLEWRGGG